MKSLSFIGSAGIPNKYGGFEAFVEHCGPLFLQYFSDVYVSCDANLYEEQSERYKGVKRVFLKVPANGIFSIIHDLYAFLKIYKHSSHIYVLGVSGGIWFPLFRFMCDLKDKRLIVNVDGLEWRRSKYGLFKKIFLKYSDAIAQIFSHNIVVDNLGLVQFLTSSGKSKFAVISYPGDYASENLPDIKSINNTALTICRIEPENQLEMLIDACLASKKIIKYTIIGNWNHSKYSRDLRIKYQSLQKIKMLDPIYDVNILKKYRMESSIYLHGHSVGGTNPSLVEMLFFNGSIFAYDCIFNRETAKDQAIYFKTSEDLCCQLDSEYGKIKIECRENLRELYKAENIVKQLTEVFN